MRRRDLLAMLGGVMIEWPLTAHAHQSTIPVIGWLSSRSPDESAYVEAAFRQGHAWDEATGIAARAGAKATVIALLVNPNNINSESASKELSASASAIGVEMRVLTASTHRDIDAAFATVVQQRADALLVNSDPFFNSRRDYLPAIRYPQFTTRASKPPLVV